MKSSSIATALTIATVTALALGVAPKAKAQTGCSNLTLKGTWADKDSGLIIGAGQFAGVNLETFDGNGHIAGSGYSSVNGAVSQGSYSGTYTVNPDCTGTYTVTFSGGGPTVHAFFVIDYAGNELQIIITDQGNVITCVAKRLYPGLAI